jgi:hypothetical protein
MQSGIAHEIRMDLIKRRQLTHALYALVKLRTQSDMMTNDRDRRRLLQLSLAVPALMALGKGTSAHADPIATPATASSGAARDFDFFLGSWHVAHRRLKSRLVGNNEWEEFDGSSTCQSILGGIANFNDSVVNRPGGSYHGMGLRAFDAKTNLWADWYLDGRNPTKIGVPGIGRFVNGVGTFLSDETFEGKPIKVRGTFSPITESSLQWEQAFSPDGGSNWETNWVMRFTRTGGMTQSATPRCSLG